MPERASLMNGPAYRVRRGTTLHLGFAVFLTLIVLALVAMPWWAGRGAIRSVTEFMYFLALAEMWNLLGGFGGLISIGQQAFVGIGGYALLVFAVFAGLNPFLSLILCGVVAGLFSLPVGFAVFRLRGAYFAIGTWVVAEVFRLLVVNIPALGGGSGTSLTRAVVGMAFWIRTATTLWVALAIGVGSVVVIYAWLRSRSGLGLTALRESEHAASSLGVRVTRLKWAVHVISAVGFGMTGGLIYLTNLSISPDAAFSVQWTVFMIFIVIIGGVGTIEGPIIGTLVFFLLRHYLSSYGSWYMILLGVIAIVVMLVARNGIWGYIHERTGFSIFPVQRRLIHVDRGEQGRSS